MVTEPVQFGFMPTKSTIQQLAMLIFSILVVQTDAIYLDIISKASNSHFHLLLLFWSSLALVQDILNQ